TVRVLDDRVVRAWWRGRTAGAPQAQHPEQQRAHTGLRACLAAGQAGIESGVGFLGASTPGMADGRTVGTRHGSDVGGAGSALAPRAGMAVGREDTLARVHRIAV